LAFIQQGLNSEEMVRSLLTKTNNMQLAIYPAALICSVIALHDLINNQDQYGKDKMGRDLEEEMRGDVAVEDKNDAS
jgi:hypothetical protein